MQVVSCAVITYFVKCFSLFSTIFWRTHIRVKALPTSFVEPETYVQLKVNMLGIMFQLQALLWYKIKVREPK